MRAVELRRHLDPSRVLASAALLFLVGFVLHTADHFRRGIDAITREVLWSGTASSILAITAIVLALRGHRLAPYGAIAVGITGFAIVAVHLAPSWGIFSDSLPDGHVDGLTWAAVLLEIMGALTFGAAGVYALRRQTEPIFRG
jgi:hypothetical protein